MTTIDHTPTPTPVPYAPPPPTRSKVPMLIGIIVTLLGMFLLLCVSVYAVSEETRADKAEARVATLTDQRDSARDDRNNTQSELSDAKEQLTACALVVEVSDLQYDQLQLVVDATTDYLDLDYAAGNAKIGKADPKAKAVNKLIEDAGFEDYESFWGACAPKHVTS
jgi:hypothetical protein